ncbi:MAG: hypothetical protein ACOCX4_10625, partial [Planctomycetota bacterium]
HPGMWGIHDGNATLPYYPAIALLWTLHYLEDRELMRCPSRTDGYLLSFRPNVNSWDLYVRNEKWKIYWSSYSWAGTANVFHHIGAPAYWTTYRVREDLMEPDFFLLADMLPEQPNTCSWVFIHYANHPLDGGNALRADGSGEWVPFGDRWVGGQYRMYWPDGDQPPARSLDYWFASPGNLPSGPRRGDWTPYAGG